MSRRQAQGAGGGLAADTRGDRILGGVGPQLPQGGGVLGGRPGLDVRVRRVGDVTDVVIPVHVGDDLDRAVIAQRHVARITTAGTSRARHQRREKWRVGAGEDLADRHIDGRLGRPVEVDLDPLVREEALQARHPDSVNAAGTFLVEHDVAEFAGRQEMPEIVVTVGLVERVPVEARLAAGHRSGFKHGERAELIGGVDAVVPGGGGAAAVRAGGYGRGGRWRRAGRCRRRCGRHDGQRSSGQQRGEPGDDRAGELAYPHPAEPPPSTPIWA